MNIFKFNYKVGTLFTEDECKDILRDLSIQDQKFTITGDFGDEDLSVYEIDYDHLDS